MFSVAYADVRHEALDGQLAGRRLLGCRGIGRRLLGRRGIERLILGRNGLLRQVLGWNGLLRRLRARRTNVRRPANLLILDA